MSSTSCCLYTSVGTLFHLPMYGSPFHFFSGYPHPPHGSSLGAPHCGHCFACSSFSSAQYPGLGSRISWLLTGIPPLYVHRVRCCGECLWCCLTRATIHNIRTIPRLVPPMIRPSTRRAIPAMRTYSAIQALRNVNSSSCDRWFDRFPFFVRSIV